MPEQLRKTSANTNSAVFAWLHALRLKRLYELAQVELYEALSVVLQGPDVVSVTMQDGTRRFEDIWRESSRIWEETGCVADEAAPANLVCDFFSASAVVRNTQDLRTCYENCCNLDWAQHGAVLVRVVNDFHISTTTPRGRYRCLLVWLAVNTSCGVLLMKASLHLEEFHQYRQAATLLADCQGGHLESTENRPLWMSLVTAWSRLLNAQTAHVEDDLEHAIEQVMQTLASMGLDTSMGLGTIPAAAKSQLAAAETRLKDLKFESRNLRPVQEKHRAFASRSSPAEVMGSPVMKLAQARIEVLSA